VLLAALCKIEARGAVETAHRARTLAGQVFRYAIATGRAERNPAADLQGALSQPHGEHFASVTEPAQVAPLLRALHGYDGTPVAVAALKLAPLVFVRPGELRHARWIDIDLDAAEWRYTTQAKPARRTSSRWPHKPPKFCASYTRSPVAGNTCSRARGAGTAR
jgi:integrase